MTTRDELVAAITGHLRSITIPATPQFADVGWPRSLHNTDHIDGHSYDGSCALCRMDIPEALPTVVGVILDSLAELGYRLYREVDERDEVAW